jgi:hypothetical protein
VSLNAHLPTYGQRRRPALPCKKRPSLILAPPLDNRRTFTKLSYSFQAPDVFSSKTITPTFRVVRSAGVFLKSKAELISLSVHIDRFLPYYPELFRHHLLPYFESMKLINIPLTVQCLSIRQHQTVVAWYGQEESLEVV